MLQAKTKSTLLYYKNHTINPYLYYKKNSNQSTSIQPPSTKSPPSLTALRSVCTGGGGGGRVGLSSARHGEDS